MAAIPATVTALLDVARGLVVEDRFDAELALRLLAAVPTDGLDVQIRGAVRHAQLVTKSALDPCTSRTTVARFTLHRVVVLLEQYIVELGIH